MSIMAWRIWNIYHGAMSQYSSLQFGYELRGLYDAVWIPGQVMQAQCNKTCRTEFNCCRWKCTICQREWLATQATQVRGDCQYCGLVRYRQAAPTSIHICDQIIHDKNDVPFSTCTCGIYSNNNNETTSMLSRSCCSVLGIAEIWGKIIVAKHGYRAQYAKMRTLIDQECGPDHGQPRPRVIAQDY